MVFGLFGPKYELGKGKVITVSGCSDEQTSGDAIRITKYFELPPGVGIGGAGGACTNAMMKIFYGTKDTPSFDGTWGDLLIALRQSIATAQNEAGVKVFTQIPQLGASYDMPLSEKVQIKNPIAKRTKALLIGINYEHRQHGKLRGSHNDVKLSKKFITQLGFTDTPATMKVLLDDGDKATADPTKTNIIAALKWLVKGAAPGDALFLHYSGHGSEVEDISGDEKSGMDQTLVPMDFDRFPGKTGHIIDDDIYKMVVGQLPADCELFCIFDCCHSGTIMDLPYVVKLTPEMEKQIAEGVSSSMKKQEPKTNNEMKPGGVQQEQSTNFDKHSPVTGVFESSLSGNALGMPVYMIVLIVAVLATVVYGAFGMGGEYSQ